MCDMTRPGYSPIVKMRKMEDIIWACVCFFFFSLLCFSAALKCSTADQIISLVEK